MVFTERRVEGKMKFKDPLNRSTAPMIIRLFDLCFRHGVFDASDLEDDFSVREFINKHKDNGTFGILGDDLEYDWQMFRFMIYRWARENHMKRLAEEYIIMVRKKDYLWAILPYCMWFYMLGMKEWLEYPSKRAIELFKTRTKRHWSPNAPNKIFMLNDYVSYMHEAAYDFRRIPEDKQPLSPHLIDSFCLAIYDLCMKYREVKNAEEDI